MGFHRSGGSAQSSDTSPVGLANELCASISFRHHSLVCDYINDVVSSIVFYICLSTLDLVRYEKVRETT